MANRLQVGISRLTEEFEESLDALEAAATNMIGAWSGSSIGYHANVYHRDLEAPPPGDHFDVQWGFSQPFASHDDTSDWQEFDYRDIQNEIYINAGDPDLGRLRQISSEIATNFRIEQSRFESVILSASKIASDTYLDGLRSKASALLIPSIHDLINLQMPRGTVVSRDPIATYVGLRHAPHQEILADVTFLRAPFGQSQQLLELCVLATDHLRLSVNVTGGAALVKGSDVDEGERFKTMLTQLHPEIYEKCHALFEKRHYPEAVEKGFKVVRDRLRTLTSYETGSEAFGKGRLYINGAAAPNVAKDFNEAVKFLTMAIDQFRNEKAHTSDANVDQPRAYEYLTLSSLAMNLLKNAEIKSLDSQRRRED